MLTLVVLETVAVLVLGVLVAGLLRSHAEILRRLHELGVGYGDQHAPDHGPGTHAAPPSTAVRLGRVEARPLSGVSPDGDVVLTAVGRAGERSMLLFLSSGCSKCGLFWDALRSGAHRALPATQVVVVCRDADEESPGTLSRLAAPDVPVVLSSAAWDDYDVPGSPFAVLVDDGRVAGRGTATTWDQLVSLVSAAASDRREARADRDLMSAGIHPGHPSLYPPHAESE